MKIEYADGKWLYYDMNDEPIHENDVVIMNGRKEKVYLTDEDELGTDATNPIWLEKGRAVPCEFGIYPFNRYDEPVLYKG